MDLELSGIHRREEILAKKRIKQDRRSNRENEKSDHEDCRMIEAHFKKSAIAKAHFLEIVLKFQLELNQGVAALLLALVCLVIVLLQQILGHGRHNGAREQIRSQHGKYDGFRQ